MVKSYYKSTVLQDLLKVLSGNIVAQGIGFLTIILISRDLGPEQYGIFSLLLSIFTIAVQVSDFGVSTSYVKYVSENLVKAKDIFVIVVLSKVILSFLITTVLFFTSDFISLYFFEISIYSELIQLIALSIFFHAFFGVLVSHFQAIQNFKVFAWLNIVHHTLKLLSVVLIAALFENEKHLEYFILSYSYAVALLLFLILITNIKCLTQIKIKNFYYFIEIYKLGFWVFLSSLATIVIMRLDIMMLQKMSTSEEVGYYSVAMNLAMIFPLITASLVTTLLPKMDQFLKERSVKEYIFRILSKAKYVIGILIVLEITSLFVIKALFGDEYIQSISVFQILLVAFIFGVIINPISLVMYSINRAYLLTAMNWVQLPLNYFGNLLLIPILQADGAAISTTFVRIFAGFYLLVILNKEYK